MSDHLTPEDLGALASGETAAADLDSARAHMTQCLSCANLAVEEWLLKTAIGKSGRRYEPPVEFVGRMESLLAWENSRQQKQSSLAGADSSSAAAPRPVLARWMAAALAVMVLAGSGILAYRFYDLYADRSAGSAEIAEACDLHIAALADTQGPQVVSSDRHTVKPWFQGKLPFSFNIPDGLPAGTTLDGANLAYLDNHPVAELLFHIDRHRVSVFVQEKNGAALPGQFTASHSGFRVVGAETDDLELIAVSDVEAGRLQSLIDDMQAAQAHR